MRHFKLQPLTDVKLWLFAIAGYSKVLALTHRC